MKKVFIRTVNWKVKCLLGVCMGGKSAWWVSVAEEGAPEVCIQYGVGEGLLCVCVGLREVGCVR